MKRRLPLLFLLGSALPLAAHPAVFHAQGMGAAAESGFVHPFTGLDHLLVMVAVGLWAVQIGGRALWYLPCSFVGAMMLGGCLGLSSSHAGLVEHGVLASLILLGTALGMAWRPPLSITIPGVAMAGLCHGYAHGSEMPSGIMPSLFLMGMIVATSLLHLLGIVAGTTLQRNGLNQAIRIAGFGLIACAACLAALAA